MSLASSLLVSLPLGLVLVKATDDVLMRMVFLLAELDLEVWRIRLHLERLTVSTTLSVLAQVVGAQGKRDCRDVKERLECHVVHMVGTILVDDDDPSGDIDVLVADRHALKSLMVEAAIGFRVEVGLNDESESEGELSWAKIRAEQSKMARPHVRR